MKMVENLTKEELEGVDAWKLPRISQT